MKTITNKFTIALFTDITLNYKPYAFMDAEEAIEHYESIASNEVLADKNNLQRVDMLAIEDMLTSAYAKYSRQPQ